MIASAPVKSEITVLNNHHQPIGPFTVEEIRQRLASGELYSSQLAHAEGLQTWIPLSEVLSYIAKRDFELSLPALPNPAPAQTPQTPGLRTYPGQAGPGNPNPTTFPAQQFPAQPSLSRVTNPQQSSPQPAASTTQINTPAHNPVPVRTIPGSNYNPLASYPSPMNNAMAFAPFFHRATAATADALILAIFFSIIHLVNWFFSLLSAFSVGPALFEMITFVVYFTLQEGGPAQATIGKQIFGLKVTSESGVPIGYGAALVRNVTKLVSSCTCCLGFLICAFTEQNKALHDFVAGTVVIETKPIR